MATIFIVIPRKNLNKLIYCDYSIEAKHIFAKPYHSWKGGQNWNINDLPGQYFPKAMELYAVDVKKVIYSIDKLNNRPRN